MRALFVALMLAIGAWAAEGGMLPETYEMLESVQDLMADQRYGEASTQLKAAADRLQRRPYDLAFVHHTHAYVHLAQERYPQAAEQFERALALDRLPVETTAGTLIALAQIYQLLEAPQKSIAILKQWQALEGIEQAAIGFLLLASAHLDLGQYEKAYTPLKAAIARKSPPPESWQQTLAALTMQLGRYDEAIALYQMLLDRSGPKKGRYWLGLASAYLMKEAPKSALDALQSALQAGVLDQPGSYKQLWHLQMAHGVPMRAARLIEKALEKGQIEESAKQYEMLFHAYRLAREHNRSLNALEQAARLEPTPERLKRLSQVAVDNSDYGRAIAAIEQALSGEPQNPGGLWSLKGVALFESGETQAAIAAFEKAAEYEKSAASARRWLGYLRSL
jgi:tetratricopeptide (TPR) repeat protein